jgi:hypothetical protein
MTTMLMLRVNTFSQSKWLEIQYGQSILIRSSEKSLCRKFLTMMKYLNDRVIDGLGVDMVKTAATMRAAATTERITVVIEHFVQTTFSKKKVTQHVVHATSS